MEPLDFENHIETTYLQYSSSWATVTPVILPGFDDPGGIRKKLSKKSDSRLTAAEKNQLLQKLDARIDQLLRKSIRQAGYSEQLAQHADISWRGTGFLPGTVLSQNYFVPSHLQRFRRYHVRINWRDENGNPIKIPGPLILGGGRFIGMGLFASLKSLV